MNLDPRVHTGCFCDVRWATRRLIVPRHMSREVHRIVQYPQDVDSAITLAVDPKQNDVPTAAPDMQCAHIRTDLIALPHPGDGRSALETGQ